MSGEGCKISFRVCEGRCEYQIHKDGELVARFGPDFDDLRKAKQEFPAATLDQTFDPKSGIFPAEYPPARPPKTTYKNKKGKTAGVMLALPPEDPRSLDHPCHREQWDSFYQTLGRALADRDSKELSAFEDEFNSLLPMTKTEARPHLERLKGKHSNIAHLVDVDHILTQLDDPVKRIRFTLPDA